MDYFFGELKKGNWLNFRIMGAFFIHFPTHPLEGRVWTKQDLLPHFQEARQESYSDNSLHLLYAIYYLLYIYPPLSIYSGLNNIYKKKI